MKGSFERMEPGSDSKGLIKFGLVWYFQLKEAGHKFQKLFLENNEEWVGLSHLYKNHTKWRSKE